MTESITFSESFAVTADNPLLRGHVVYGRSLLPGVGYVDLVLQVLARHGHAMPDVELRNLTILAPLVAASGEQVLTTVEGRPAPMGGWRIEVRSRRQHDTVDVVHAVVTAHRHARPAFREELSLPIAGVTRITPLADIYDWCREHELLHSGLMKIGGVIHHRAGDWVAELELAPEHRRSIGAFLFHPALFEAGLLGGGVAIGMLHEGDDGPGLYLPLMFESFRAAAPLGERCFVRVPADSVQRNDELVRLAVEFYDAAGVQVAQIGQFVGKRVRAATALDVRQEPGSNHASRPGSNHVSNSGSVVLGARAVEAETAPAAASGSVVSILRDLVAARLEEPSEEINVDTGYYELGLASADLLSLVAELEDRLSLSLSPTIMFEYKSIADLAPLLETQLAARGPARAAGRARLEAPSGGRGDRVPSDLDIAGDDGTTLSDGSTGRGGDEGPHPMLHRLVRDGGEIAYETRFDGREPYLRNHQVRGSRVLPGVAHLEMARAAVALARGDRESGRLRLSDVVWLRPAISGPDGLKLRVDLRATSGGGHEYAIHSVDGDGARTLCSQGRASHLEDGERSHPRLDDLRRRCAEAVFPAAHVYGLYAGMGLEYGPAQRSLVELNVGRDDAGRPQVLAELRLPAEAEHLSCSLHPSILDGALQATLGLWLTATRSNGRAPRLALPFAVEHVEAAAAIPPRAYAWIRHQPGSETDAASARLDVTVFDEHGRMCVELIGLSTRALADAPSTPAVTSSSARHPEQERAARREVDGTEIAIVGVSGRYPEAADLDEFWRNLRAGRDCIREIPAERWDHRPYAGTATCKWGGFLDDIDRFDPLFFQISMLEAEHLDPQERLFLQCAHHVLEDAGYTGDRLAKGSKVGVFVGVMYQEYQLFGAEAQARGHQVALWGSASTVANRVSYFYDFHGPSLAVDTMCSSSLTAIHLACEAIKSGQCEAAIAGGVNLSPHPNKYLVLSQRRFLASDGRCRSFGQGGDGYVPGEGVGAVLLKPLARAIADGDHVYGVIEGSAVNHGGRTSGYSVPTPVAQGEVIAEALLAAGVEPRALSYLEAHGTGTSLGDPIEIAGLERGFRQAGGSPPSCAIGSVKSNIGHCESAAGIAAVTKVLLQMQHEELVPSLHSGALNPHIDFERSPLRVQQHLEPWRRPTLEIDGVPRTFPRIAGVSSFGGGGSNAHVVISEYEPGAPRSASLAGDRRPRLLVLSAKSEAQLVEQARRLRARLAELREEDLLDVARTLQTGRMALEERLAFAATSLEDARSILGSFAVDPQRPGAWVRGTVLGRSRDTGAEALRSAMSDWCDRGAYDRLLGLWAGGAVVDWDASHPGTPMRRISLPGYPFARERCWLDVNDLSELAPRLEGPAERAEPDEVMLLRPVWTARDAVSAERSEGQVERQVVVIGRLAGGEREALRAALPAAVGCEFVEIVNDTLDRQYTEATQRVFGLTRRILERGVRRPVLLQVVLIDSADSDAGRERLACFGGLSGLLKTAHLENPLLHTQYLELLDRASPATVAARLAAEGTDGLEPEVRHRDGRRFVGRLEALSAARTAAAPWKEGGVYLITGGAGALGMILAREIAASVREATLVLVGRSPLGEVRESSLDALRAAGAKVDYRRADVSDRPSVARLLADVKARHGALSGILHGAGTIEDGFILRKSGDELARVLAPKVAGLVNLDELSRDQPLDIFLCLSSIGGVFGNPGQADYAAANAFMDAYAVYRNRLVDAGVCSGRTVSIDWPLWDAGGMGAGDEVRAPLRKMGLAPLDTAQGLAALRCAWAARDNGLEDGRLVVIAGRRSALLPRLTVETGREPVIAPVLAEPPARPAAEATPARGALEASAARALEEKAAGYLRRLFAAALKLGPERVDVDTPLERYGMDSVLAVDLIARLEVSFGPLSRTLLFEVQTVRELARHFATRDADALRVLLGEPPLSQTSTDSAATRPAPATEGPAPRRAEYPRSDAEESPRARDATKSPRGPGASVPIAIIGISGRYPQAEDLAAFWANLRDGKDCVTEVPAERWKLSEPSGPDASASRGRWWGGFLEGVDRFDPLFFGISPREAALMDPQQRLFLETVWHLLEQSGVTQEVLERRYERRVGVYVGAANQMYRADGSDPALAALTSSASYNLIANRVSHFFGLEGPSLAVDSMCTSAAMAVHLACADLQRGESELAIAGGINLTIHPDKYVALSEMQLLGTHPGSRSFRDGDGYLPAEGVGAVLLKPLDAALRDGDTVLAVITGTASLHAGRANGFMTPSHKTRVNVMRRALERAGVDPGAIGYVEDAANGSALADEVGLRALREVFGGVTEPVALGSVKSNLGHPEAASGIAQLTKVVLQMQHGELTPLVEVGAPNPNLDLEGSPLRLCDRLAAWEPRGEVGEDGRPAPRRALINAVAAGGSHVSLVVEAPPWTEAAPRAEDTGPELVVLSALSPERLRTAAERLHDFLEREGSVSLADVAYTSQLGREALPERLAVVASSPDELKRALAHHLALGSVGDEAGPTASAPGALSAVPLFAGNTEDDAAPLGALLSGSRGEAFLSGLVADGDLERLAELWVRGVRVPWRGLHRDRRRLVPLPATAFESGAHWVGRSRPITVVPSAPSRVDAATVTVRVANGRPRDRELTATERTVASAWAELLQIEADTLRATSNFFSLGGNSLLATRLINLLKQGVGVELPVQAVFHAPRLAEMALELERHTSVALSGRTPQVDMIRESIELIERMSDEELDAVAS